MTARDLETVYTEDGSIIWRGWSDRKPSDAKLAYLKELRTKQAHLVGGIPPQNFWKGKR